MRKNSFYLKKYYNLYLSMSEYGYIKKQIFYNQKSINDITGKKFKKRNSSANFSAKTENPNNNIEKIQL